MTPTFLKVPPNTLGTGKATKVKFGRTIQSDSLSKNMYLFPKMGVAMSCDPINFGVHPNVSPKRVELET